jgi:putative membrane protein
MMWHNGYGWGMGGGYWLFGVFFWAFGIAAVVALIVMLIRRSTGMGFHRGWYGHEPDALEIAKRRYARGEITKEQFEQLKKDLTG